MTDERAYFFCGIGGSGMLPLALILKARGAEVKGSDRALDQGRTPAKFDFLRGLGISLFPQDGSGLSDPAQILVASAAVEETVPDVQAARRLGAAMVLRPELLARLFNAAETRIGVAGTSGKSTTTAMLAWILHRAGRDPTVMNGAVMKNFADETRPFASAVVGAQTLFVSEVDESDGSIAHYEPTIAVINNIALDHKTMDELRVLFGDFAAKAQTVVLNLDNAETRALAEALPVDRVATYSLEDPKADLRAAYIKPEGRGLTFEMLSRSTGELEPVELKTPGRHNVANALAALSAAAAAGVPLREGARALASFEGVSRRLDLVGVAHGVTVIDDFAHNPDKIAATLATLRETPGRLMVMFQPHGYGPLRTLREGLVETFAAGLQPTDVLLMPEPVYYGGTVERTVGSGDIAADLKARDRDARALPTRDACGDLMIDLARPGDTFVVMGARDDTLTSFAADLLGRLAAKPS